MVDCRLKLRFYAQGSELWGIFFYIPLIITHMSILCECRIHVSNLLLVVILCKRLEWPHRLASEGAYVTSASVECCLSNPAWKSSRVFRAPPGPTTYLVCPCGSTAFQHNVLTEYSQVYGCYTVLVYSLTEHRCR